MIDDATAENIQALVFSGFGSLPHTTMLRVQGVGPAWLRGLLPFVAFGRKRAEIAAQVLITKPGLRALGATDEQLDALGRVYVDGMTSEPSRLRLGDAGPASPDRWTWTDRDHDGAVILYGKNAIAVADAVAAASDGVEVVGCEPLRLPKHGREPFGFRDGIAMIRLARPDRTAPDIVPDGELLLGHLDATGNHSGGGELGKNGAFVAVRELHQTVEEFWAYWMELGGDAEQAIFLASKAVGRWPNGMPIEPGVEREPDFDESKLRIASFLSDRHGDGCPFGSHIRRAHPRDTLVGSVAESNGISAIHKILRRGRLFGTPAPTEWYPAPLREAIDEGDASPDGPRGLMFLALCTDLRRQFEFIEQNWLHNPKHADLYNEVDPILGREDMPRTFGVTKRGFCRYIDRIGGWVLPRGGGYYLLPSREALESLAGGNDLKNQ